MLTTQVEYPANFEACSQTAMDALRARLGAMRLRDVWRLALPTREPGLTLKVHVTFLTRRDGSLRRVELIPVSASADAIAPDAQAAEVHISADPKADLPAVLRGIEDAWLRRAVAWRIRDEGRELGHLATEEIKELLAETARAARYYWERNDEVEVLTLREVARQELVLRERDGDTAHLRMQSYARAAPLRQRLQEEMVRAQAWCSETPEDEQAKYLKTVVADLFTPEEQSVLAFRSYIDANDALARYSIAAAAVARAKYGLPRLA